MWMLLPPPHYVYAFSSVSAFQKIKVPLDSHWNIFYKGEANLITTLGMLVCLFHSA